MWNLAELTFMSRTTLQVTFAAEFDDNARNTSEEGIALDDISMKQGPCTGAG